jgi:hypothetical protein
LSFAEHLFHLDAHFLVSALKAFDHVGKSCSNVVLIVEQHRIVSLKISLHNIYDIVA